VIRNESRVEGHVKTSENIADSYYTVQDFLKRNLDQQLSTS